MSYNENQGVLFWASMGEAHPTLRIERDERLDVNNITITWYGTSVSPTPNICTVLMLLAQQ